MLQAKVILKSHHFLIILPHYSIVYPLAIVIDICCICKGKGLYNACYCVSLPDSVSYNVRFVA